MGDVFGRAAPVGQISTKLDEFGDIADVIDGVKFHIDR